MKTIVVYKSKSGFVKKYAEWIANELDADITEASKVSVKSLKDYENIIFGGGLYAVGINGIQLITKNFTTLKSKNIIVFASGASPFREEILAEIQQNNFTPEQSEHIKLFYLRGGFEYSKLNLIDKGLMHLLKFKLKNKRNLTPDDKGMLAAFDTPVDFTRQQNIEALISYVKKVESK